MSDLSSAEESDEDKGKNKISFSQMKTGMAGMKLEEPCQVCKKTVFKSDPKTVDVGGKLLHPLCFRCVECNCSLTLKTFKTDAGKYYCPPHYPKAKATQVMDQTTELGVKNMQTTENLKRYEGNVVVGGRDAQEAARQRQQAIDNEKDRNQALFEARSAADRAKIREEGDRAVETAAAIRARGEADLAKQREERTNRPAASYEAPAPAANRPPPGGNRPTGGTQLAKPLGGGPSKPSGPVGGGAPPPRGPSAPSGPAKPMGGGAPPRASPPSGPSAPPRGPPPKQTYEEPAVEEPSYEEPVQQSYEEPEQSYEEPAQEEEEPYQPPVAASRPPPKGPPGPRAPPRPAAAPKYPVGSTCLALYPADGGFYPAVVTDIQDGQYYINYTEYDEAGGPFGEDSLKPE